MSTKYYSLMLSPNISKTVHGYLICENVPLCRSGLQEYLGKELKGFPGYEDSWGLEPDQRYQIYRPKESVLDPEFIRSIEGNTVVDEHPDGSVVHVGNDQELNCGHVEKVGKGEELDGEVTLKGDLHVKNPELIEKIRPEADPDADYAVRDVSLGYSLKLKRLEDKTIVMYHLRGNHVAVVTKGRAGPQIAIQDSAIPEPEPPKPEIKPKKKEKNMSIRDMIFGKGLKAHATDATPEEMAELAIELSKPTELKILPKVVVDAEPEHPHAEHHAAFMDYCDKGGDKDALMKFLKGEHVAHDDEGEKKEDLEELQEKEEKDEDEGEKKEDGEEDSDEKTVAEEHGAANDAGDIDDAGESVLKQANDSVHSFLKTTRPIVAAIINKPKSKRNELEQTMVDSYNSTVKSLNAAKGTAYAKLSKSKVPTGIPALATDSSAVLKTEVTTCNCFEGVPYRVGLKKHEAHTQKENK